MARSYLCTIIYSHVYAWGYHVCMLQRRVRIFADKRVCGRTRVITRCRGCWDRLRSNVSWLYEYVGLLWLLIGIGPFMIRNTYAFDLSLIHFAILLAWFITIERRSRELILIILYLFVEVFSCSFEYIFLIIFSNDTVWTTFVTPFQNNYYKDATIKSLQLSGKRDVFIRHESKKLHGKSSLFQLMYFYSNRNMTESIACSRYI